MTLTEAITLIRGELPHASVSVSKHVECSAFGRVAVVYTLSATLDRRITEVLVLQRNLSAAVDELIARVKARRVPTPDDQGDALAVAERDDRFAQL